MGDNKISEAVTAAAAAIDELHDEMTDARIGSEVARQFAECAINAALPHLQGEAVPVAWQVRDEVGGWRWCQADQGCYQMVKRHRPHDARALYEHPQPAELNEVSGNSGELPPLPPVDGYDKRVQGHYSAEQMRDYARNAIRSAKQEQACSGMGIDKMAKELLERHTVAVPVAVEDGRCFMVREQEALDAIRAALAATGKQQVGEAERERDLLAEAIHKAAIKSGIYRADLEGMSGPQLLMACDDMAECIKAQQVGEVQGDAESMRAEWLAAGGRVHGPNVETVTMPEADYFRFRSAIASRQPVGEPVGRVIYSQNKHGHGEWDFMPAGPAYAVLKITPKVGGQFADQRFDVYAAPPAQGIDLGQFRDSVIHECLRAHAEWQGDLMTYDEYLAAEQKRDRLLALIDGRDASPGVGNVQPPRDLRTKLGEV